MEEYTVKKNTESKETVECTNNISEQIFIPKIKPFFIGICGGSASGKTSVATAIIKEIGMVDQGLASLLPMDSYYRNLDEEEYKNLNEFNFDHPDAFDFELLLEHLTKLISGESIQMPIYNFVTSTREIETHEIKSSPLIIFEGIFAFYDRRIRNLMDLKIFVDTDADTRLARRIYRDIKERGRSLSTIIGRYHKFVKPAFDDFIRPTRKFADVVIPRGLDNVTAIRLVSQHLLLQLDKMNNNQKCECSKPSNALFASLNDIVDPKFHFFDHKVIVSSDSSQIENFKQIFEDYLTNKEELVTYVNICIVQLINHLLTMFSHFLKENTNHDPRFDLIINEMSDLKDIDFKKYKNIVYFQTCILGESDLEIPEKIMKQNLKCTLLINTIFLSPKFTEVLLNSKNNIKFQVFLTSIYFSDFFIKYEYIIKNKDGIFNRERLVDYYNQFWPNYFQ